MKDYIMNLWGVKYKPLSEVTNRSWKLSKRILWEEKVLEQWPFY